MATSEPPKDASDPEEPEAPRSTALSSTDAPGNRRASLRSSVRPGEPGDPPPASAPDAPDAAVTRPAPRLTLRPTSRLAARQPFGRGVPRQLSPAAAGAAGAEASAGDGGPPRQPWAPGLAPSSKVRPVPDWATPAGTGQEAGDGALAGMGAPGLGPTGRPDAAAALPDGPLPPGYETDLETAERLGRPRWGLAVLGGFVAVGVTALVVAGFVWAFGLVGDSEPAAGPEPDGAAAPEQAAPDPGGAEGDPAGAEGQAGGTVDPTPSTGEAASPAAEPADLAPGFPAETLAVQGQQYWAVVADLAYDSDDPELAASWDSLREVGYQAGLEDVDCLRGARETFQLDGDREYYAVAVLFDTRERAQQFVDAYEPGVVGTSQVLAFCAS